MPSQTSHEHKALASNSQSHHEVRSAICTLSPSAPVLTPRAAMLQIMSSAVASAQGHKFLTEATSRCIYYHDTVHTAKLAPGVVW